MKRLPKQVDNLIGNLMNGSRRHFHGVEVRSV